MANDDGSQGGIVTNIPYDFASVIVYKTAHQQIRTVLYKGSVTAGRNGLEARVGVTVGWDERDDENQDLHDYISFTYLRKSMS